MIPRIRRSAILRAIDRLAGRKISITLGSTDIIASECVTLGNSDGTAELIGEAGFAFADELTLEDSSIERSPRTGPFHGFRAIVDRRNPANLYVNIKLPIRIRVDHADTARCRWPLEPNPPDFQGSAGDRLPELAKHEVGDRLERDPITSLGINRKMP
jgi:hypothetical protein